MMRLWRASRGDTIVEVLIAITVVSFVLGGAYVTANHSYRNMRQAQERGEALKYVQEQLERLKAIAPDPSSYFDVFSTSSPFCITSSNTKGVVGSAACNTGTNPNAPYAMSIFRVASGSGYSFTVTATWPEFGGNVNDVVSILYKVDT